MTCLWVLVSRLNLPFTAFIPPFLYFVLPFFALVPQSLPDHFVKLDDDRRRLELFGQFQERHSGSCRLKLNTPKSSLLIIKLCKHMFINVHITFKQSHFLLLSWDTANWRLGLDTAREKDDKEKRGSVFMSYVRGRSAISKKAIERFKIKLITLHQITRLSYFRGLAWGRKQIFYL